MTPSCISLHKYHKIHKTQKSHWSVSEFLTPFSTHDHTWTVFRLRQVPPSMYANITFPVCSTIFWSGLPRSLPLLYDHPSLQNNLLDVCFYHMTSVCRIIFWSPFWFTLNIQGYVLTLLSKRTRMTFFRAVGLGPGPITCRRLSLIY